MHLPAQEACPQAGRQWSGSSGSFLAVLAAQQCLSANITAEHHLLRRANMAFRKACSAPATTVACMQA